MDDDFDNDMDIADGNLDDSLGDLGDLGEGEATLEVEAEFEETTEPGGSRSSAPSSARPLPRGRPARITAAPAARASGAVPSREPSSTTTTSSTRGRRATTQAPIRSASSRAATSATARRPSASAAAEPGVTAAAGAAPRRP